MIVVGIGPDDLRRLANRGVRKFAERVQVARVTSLKRGTGTWAFPSRGEVLGEESQGGSGSAVVRPAIVTRQTDTPPSQKFGDLVDCAVASLLLVGKALGEFTPVLLASSLKRHEVSESYPPVASNAVGHDFSSIEDLVEVTATDSEVGSRLVRSESCFAADDADLCAPAEAIGEAHENFLELFAGSMLGELHEFRDLLVRDARG